MRSKLLAAMRIIRQKAKSNPEGQHRRAICILTAALVAVCGTLTWSCGRASASPDVTCRGIITPVSLSAAKSHVYQIWGRLCSPRHARPTTVQLLIHGATYTSSYWDWPVDPSRHSYVRHAAAAGYATFAIDRIGHGRSSRPASEVVDTEANVASAHQIVQGLRDGTIGRYTDVITVGHSYGSAIVMEEAARFADVNAVILTGLTHKLAASGMAAVERALRPAVGALPRFEGLDGYLTTRPNTRKALFYHGDTDPKVLAYDEANRDTVTRAEFNTFGASLTDGSARLIRVPVLLVVGEYDAILCGDDGSDCSSSASLRNQEQPFFRTQFRQPAGQCEPDGADCNGPARIHAEQNGQKQSLTTYILPAAGHDINLSQNAPYWYALASNWAKTHVSPDGNTASIQRVFR